MNKIFIALSLAALAASAAHSQSEVVAFGARSFESMAEAAVMPLRPADAFAGVAECGTLDIKTIRPWSLEEAAYKANPCLKAVGAKYSAVIKAEAGLVEAASQGRPMKPGLILKTDLVAGSQAYRDLSTSLARRSNQLLGHRVLLLARGEAAPASVSAVQDALKQCMIMTVVRDINTSADFVQIYGTCLTRNKALKIDELRAGAGLTVNMKTEQDANTVEALNGFVTVNAGRGPVSVMIIAYGAKVAMP
ncbi:MAG: hypothetical protein ACHQ2Z_08675 [Elusimicrobiota bacterium]